MEIEKSEVRMEDTSGMTIQKMESWEEQGEGTDVHYLNYNLNTYLQDIEPMAT